MDKIHKISYFFSQAILGFITALQKQVTPEVFYGQSLFPMTQAVNLSKIAMIALGKDKSLTLSNLGDQVVSGSKISMMVNSIIVVVMVLLHIVMIAYIWPYRISPNPERPLKWYYPCVCGCLRNKRKDDKVDGIENHF